MGAWGIGPFDNDEAMDWIIDVANGDSAQEVNRILGQPTPADGAYIEVDDCHKIIAAAELLARVVHKDAVGVDDAIGDVIGFLAQTDLQHLRPRAVALLERLLQPGSEVLALMCDPPGNPNCQPWRDAMKDRIGRLVT